jgi:N-methylhydantoinase B/oxoprolinase/acetone carboxylase alpha subunit
MSGNAAGQGAQFDHDGEDAFGFFWGACVDSSEGEIADSRFPSFSLARAIESNAHGYGKFRGGSAMVDISMAYGASGCFMTSSGSSDKISHNPGLFGGYSGPPNTRVVIRDSNVTEMLAAGDPKLNFSNGHELLTERPIDGRYDYSPSSMPTEHFCDGDIFMLNSGGAGGYGDVLERETDAVALDVKRKIITPDVAQAVYGVVVDLASFDVDEAATLELRTTLRRQRLELSQPFDEFIEGWLKKRPPAEILKYYGEWPDPRVPGYDKPFWGQYS